LLPFPKGEVKENPRKGFLYWSDDGDLMALRVGNWKVHFMEERAHGFDVWREPIVSLRAPNIFNLRNDPFERARTFLLVPAQVEIAKGPDASGPTRWPRQMSLRQ
jgi:hypothetical protein